MKKAAKIILFSLAVVLACEGCKNHHKLRLLRKKPKNYTVLTLKPLISQSTLYFSGELRPKDRMAVVSPASGVITKQDFIYGEAIKKDQVLFELKSAKLQTSYQEDLIAYLKAKQSYIDTRAKYQSSVKLYNNGLISTEDYYNSRNAYLLSRLTYTQSRIRLLNNAGKRDLRDIDKLSLDNIDEVVRRLNLQKTFQILYIKSPGSGVALLGKNGKAKLGTTVKKDEVMFYLGDLSALASTINISEINVNQFNVGQPVTVTGSGFAPLVLKGYIENIAAQAVNEEGAAIFTASIVIPNLSAEAKKIVKFGMNVKIAISIEHPPHLMVPIKAVDVNTSTVQLLDPATGNIKPVTVETGETTFDDVTILSGLKAGDKVIVPN